jgi:hypothetical protein
MAENFLCYIYWNRIKHLPEIRIFFMNKRLHDKGNKYWGEKVKVQIFMAGDWLSGIDHIICLYIYIATHWLILKLFNNDASAEATQL